jgi:hypothetical protein
LRVGVHISLASTLAENGKGERRLEKLKRRVEPVSKNHSLNCQSTSVVLPIYLVLLLPPFASTLLHV